MPLLVRVQFVSSRVHPTIEKIEFKIKSTKVASAKVAFDTVRISSEMEDHWLKSLGYTSTSLGSPRHPSTRHRRPAWGWTCACLCIDPISAGSPSHPPGTILRGGRGAVLTNIFSGWETHYVTGFYVTTERKISPKLFRPRFFHGRLWGCPVPQFCQHTCFFPWFGGPDRSFWPDVRRDIRPKTFSLGWFFVLWVLSAPTNFSTFVSFGGEGGMSFPDYECVPGTHPNRGRVLRSYPDSPYLLN